MTQTQQIIKVLTMWTNYYNIPATLEENVTIQQQRDRTPPLQIGQEILHQLEDEMGMNVDESKNQSLSTQLMHSFLHASSETSSLNKIMKLYALPSNLSKMTVPKRNEEVEITSAYQSNERFITAKEKSLYSVQNYAAKALAIISQMRDAVLNDADARKNGTSLNNKKVNQIRDTCHNTFKSRSS